MKAITDTFVEVAEDCPVEIGIVPPPGQKTKPIHRLEYELLTAAPYRYTHEELVFAVHVHRQGLSPEEIARRGSVIRAELFSRGHPCLRASALTKRYGWGAHYDAEGRIALYPLGSAEYRAFAEREDGPVKRVRAMRSRRA